MLGDLGAEVIKIERPGAGDDTRAWGPPFLKDKDGNETRESAYYLSVNRGKRSLAIDLATDEGRAIVRALAGRADILLENFKAGTLAKFGLDYDAMEKVNPRLIYCSITGFGQSGPRRDEAAYDFAIQAMGGLMSITGQPDGAPGGGPQKVGVPIVDLMTGMYAAVAVLAALAGRERSGRGDYIDLAMLDVLERAGEAFAKFGSKGGALRAVDVGSQDFRYAFALERWLRRLSVWDQRTDREGQRNEKGQPQRAQEAFRQKLGRTKHR
mgnify:CR=1 FL=1